MFNETYVNGDFGGNAEKILILNQTEMILHSYFDSGALRLDGFSRPLNVESLSRISQLA